MRNLKNILLHELIGLECNVVDSRNKSQIGLSGNISDETMKTIVINGKRVFKNESVFRIKIDGEKVDIDGDYLIGRSEDRIKKKLRKW